MGKYNPISNINMLGEKTPTVDPEYRDYTFSDIVTTLDLDDSPSLLFTFNGEDQNIQDSHITAAEMLAIPHWADSLWTYKETTDEWIPIFHFSKENTIAITELVDMEPDVDPFAMNNRTVYATPKGFFEPQYYRIQEGKIVGHHGKGSPVVYDLVEFDERGYSKYHYVRINNPGCCAFCKQPVEVRRTYRDPEEGNSVLYEACVPCINHRHEQDRKAWREEQDQYEYEHGSDDDGSDDEPDYPEDEDNMNYAEDDEPDELEEK